MKRRKFIKLLGLGSVSTLLPLSLFADVKSTNLYGAIEKAVLVYGDNDWIDPEPLYQRVEVSMNNDFDYYALFERDTGSVINSDFISIEGTLPFSYEYRKVSE